MRSWRSASCRAATTPRSERSASEAQKIFRARGAESLLEYAQTYLILGQVSYRLGAAQDGNMQRYYQTGLDLVAAHHPRNQARIQMLLGLSRAVEAVGELEQALAYGEEAARLIDAGAVDTDSIIRGNVYQSVGGSLNWAGRNEEAERSMRKAIEQQQARRRGAPIRHRRQARARDAAGLARAARGSEDLLESALAVQQTHARR